MSRVCVIILFAGSALSAAPIDIRIPLHFARNQFLSLHVTVENRGTTFRIESLLNIDPTIVLATNAAVSGPANIIFDNADNPEMILTVHAGSPLWFSPPAISFIGLGSSGVVTQHSGAVAVIKNGTRGADLILGSTMDSFTSSCAAGTLFTFHPAVENRVIPKLVIGDEEGTEFGIRQLLMDNSRFLFSVPPDIYEVIEGLILDRGGASLVSTYNLYSECTVAVLQHLPKIKLVFAFGSVVYFPQDYVEFNRIEDTCQLLFFSSSTDTHLMFNPLRIPDANVRITRDNQWSFCDSAATYYGTVT